MNGNKPVLVLYQSVKMAKYQSCEKRSKWPEKQRLTMKWEIIDCMIDCVIDAIALIHMKNYNLRPKKKKTEPQKAAFAYQKQPHTIPHKINKT